MDHVCFEFVDLIYHRLLTILNKMTPSTAVVVDVVICLTTLPMNRHQPISTFVWSLPFNIVHWFSFNVALLIFSVGVLSPLMRLVSTTFKYTTTHAFVHSLSSFSHHRKLKGAVGTHCIDAKLLSYPLVIHLKKNMSRLVYSDLGQKFQPVAKSLRARKLSRCSWLIRMNLRFVTFGFR